MNKSKEAKTMSQVESPETPSLKIVDRMVSEVPLVKLAKDLVEDGYGRVRKMNNLTETAFDLAERSFYLWATAAKQLMSVFQTPITYADNLACDGLEKLEQVVPAIQKKPEELLEDVKKYTTERVETVKDTGLKRAEPLLISADGALNNAINFANSWLPQTENDVPKEGNSLNRFYALSGKVRTLVEQQATNTAAKIWPSRAQ